MSKKKVVLPEFPGDFSLAETGIEIEAAEVE